MSDDNKTQKERDLEKANAQKEGFKVPDGGIEWNRSCTDVLCCLAFLAFLVVMLGISGWALGAGDPYNIITPYDSVGHKCGAKGTDYEEYPNKHFTSLLMAQSGSAQQFHAVCVSECPKNSTDFNDKCKTNTDISSCGPQYAAYDTEERMHYCLPTKEHAEAAYNMIAEEIEKQSGMGQYIL